MELRQAVKGDIGSGPALRIAAGPFALRSRSAKPPQDGVSTFPPCDRAQDARDRRRALAARDQLAALPGGRAGGWQRNMAIAHGRWRAPPEIKAKRFAMPNSHSDAPVAARTLAALCAVALAAFGRIEPLGAAESLDAAESLGTYESSRHRFRVVKLIEGLDHPWGLAFLPNGSALVTERPGRLRRIVDGRLDPKPIAGVPAVYARGQGGLLDVALHPRFDENQLVYLSYASPGGGGAATAVLRGRLAGGRLQDVEEIYTALPRSRGGRHFGSRLLFAGGHLFVSAGERADPDRAQALDDPAGSIIRLDPDGRAPKDNPFVARPRARPEIYSYGNRNPQGLAQSPQTGQIYAVEHGPRGGDELNLIEPGVNYGWPVITHGRSYAGFKIGEGTRKKGMAQPVHYWVPSISPSGLMIYSAERFPAWRGSFFVGALSGKLLARLEIEAGKPVVEERLLADLGERIRDVRQGPDGLIYLLTDRRDGMLLRLEPVE